MTPPNHVLQKCTYTNEYIREHSREKGCLAAEEAWTSLLERNRHLYFSVMAPLTQYSSDDRRPRYYTEKQLNQAALIIEKSTESVMEYQYQLLLDWHKSASLFQAAWRGYATRRITRIALFARRIQRMEELYYLAFHRRRLMIARHERYVRNACKHVKKLVLRAHTSAQIVQTCIRLYLFKCQRWNASTKIALWYRHTNRNRKLHLSLNRLHRFLTWKRREVELTKYANAALQARKRQIQSRQAAYFTLQPDQVIVHRLVLARKQDVYRALHPKAIPRSYSSIEMAQALPRMPMATKEMMAKAVLRR
ncbi:hypothetical protein THRCLA_07613 [Thraustotheca clavata]|uniref:Uncharacterized protein n=1 Tax=Thraustotheca clavata TaxID=74557 RepID=A0A1V9ZCL1_9STRA|nr:hypothetical protein THRCLA_07613 [Thraustotheca clavata]